MTRHVELAEGDILLLRGRRLVSRAIALVSHGYSHMGLVLRIEGVLCLCHSTPNRIARSVFGDVHEGVQATPIVTLLRSGAYTRAHAYRLASMTPARRRAARMAFAEAYGLPFEWAPCCYATEAMLCSELVTRMLGLDERLVRPSDALGLEGLRLVGSLGDSLGGGRVERLRAVPLTDAEVEARRVAIACSTATRAHGR